jgi:hypothetical protein
MRKFLFLRTSIENVNIVQSETEVEEPSPIVPRLSNIPRVATGAEFVCFFDAKLYFVTIILKDNYYILRYITTE